MKLICTLAVILYRLITVALLVAVLLGLTLIHDELTTTHDDPTATPAVQVPANRGTNV